jgi:hypothetical protein
MPKIKAKAKKTPVPPPAKKKLERKKPEDKTLTDLFREPSASKKPEPKKPKTSYHDVSVPSSEFTQQLGSNYLPPEQNGQ